ncbi:F0F1 ATP synthase subunit gamma [Accumulibacter sp.]|uniref:F0F1 ATP synthase subunit gamma n=1 Tax=Accumulibacter sp. TaxID=2053492 RepID=UPI00258FF4BF|nr:F0F1 ATP synthase subunit gamma [Accumulibacter sp.]
MPCLAARKSATRSRASRARARSPRPWKWWRIQDAQGAGQDARRLLYGDKIRRVAGNLSHALTDYRHPFLTVREQVKAVGLITVTSDKGALRWPEHQCPASCAGKMKEWDAEGKLRVTAIGNKGLGFMQGAGANGVSKLTGLGDTPQLEKLIGPGQVQLTRYMKGKTDVLYIAFTRFINTMKQEPTLYRLLPLSGELVGGEEATDGTTSMSPMPRR